MQADGTVDTSDNEQNFYPLINATPGARARTGAHKIAGATLIELLSADVVLFLGAEVVGCLFLLLQKMLSEGFTSLQYPAAVRLIHVHAKVRQERAKEILGLLLDAGIVTATGGETDEGLIHIPALTRAVEAIEGERSRRIQGWSSRRKSAADKAATATIPRAKASDAEGAATAAAGGEERSQDEYTFSAAEPAVDESTPMAPDDVVASTDDDLMGAVSLMAEALQEPLEESVETSQAHASTDLFPDEGQRIHYLAHETESRDRVVDIIAVDGSIVRVTRGYIEWLQQAVPNVDVEQQTRLAAAWCQENKSRRKTVKRMGAFLLSWMSRHSSSLRIQQAATEHSARRGQFGAGQVTKSQVSGAAAAAPFDDGIGDLTDLEMLPVVGDGCSLSFPV